MTKMDNNSHIQENYFRINNNINIERGTTIKFIGKVILTAALYAIAYGLAKKVWR